MIILPVFKRHRLENKPYFTQESILDLIADKDLQIKKLPKFPSLKSKLLN